MHTPRAKHAASQPPPAFSLPGVAAAAAETLAPLVVLVALLAAALTPVTSLGQPNIVLIFSDDAGYNHFGFTSALNGTSTEFETPRLDELAQQSVVVSSGYVASPVCSPSRASLLTGLHAQRFGYERNVFEHSPVIDQSNTSGLPGEQATMADYLGDLGYTTGVVGKWHLGAIQGLNRPLDKGFDEFYGFLGGSRSYYGELSHEYRTIRRGEGEPVPWTTEGDSSKYDPTRGRYLTDAFGEEAVDFINRHAAGPEPFFLYLPLTAPHSPYDTKQADLDRFSHIENGTVRQLAAMTYAMDRSVGEVLDALAANGVDDETVVVFVNDNGGVEQAYNTPFRGRKGDVWEGGSRVPFMIHAPGVPAGVYDEPITALDLLPTFLSAAGGDPLSVPTDGADVLPYLSGDAEGRPTELQFSRWYGKWFVRRGDWKLERVADTGTFVRLHNLADDPGEHTNLKNDFPEITAELYRELDRWEAQLAKPAWGNGGSPNVNAFDHFVWEEGATGDFSDDSAWTAAGAPEVPVTMDGADAYANLVVEFRTSDDASYIASNDMRRATDRTFMLNRVVLSGGFAGDETRSGVIDGLPLLLVNSLEGAAPRLELEATNVAGASDFAFRVENELRLMHDLEIGGDGSQEFVLSGPIVDYFEPRNVTKTGASKIVLAGESAFSGVLTVEDGEVAVDGPTAAVHGPSAIHVESQGTFSLVDGAIDVGSVVTAPGGTFQLAGGRLSMDSYVGNLVNDGGVLAPRASAVLGDYTQTPSGEIEFSVSAAGESSYLAVSGEALLEGELHVVLDDGDVPDGEAELTVLTSQSLSGQFANAASGDTLAHVSGDEVLSYRVFYGDESPHETNAVVLADFAIGLPGDFNGDGLVDAADYAVFRDGFAAGAYNEYDYRAWRDFYGATTQSLGAALQGSAVPEPASGWVLLVGLSGALRRRSQRRLHGRHGGEA